MLHSVVRITQLQVIIHVNKTKLNNYNIIHCVQKKNTHSRFLSYLHELCVDLNKNCNEYTQGKVDSDNVEIRYSLRPMT